jgi:hypothetical protein
LGIGLDGADQHVRITKADDVVLLGGSEETHERMQETVIKVNEALERQGKSIRDVSGDEMADLIRQAQR